MQNASLLQQSCIQLNVELRASGKASTGRQTSVERPAARFNNFNFQLTGDIIIATQWYAVRDDLVQHNRDVLC